MLCVWCEQGIRGVCVCVCLTTRLGEVLVELLAVFLMEDIVHAGVDELFLFVLQVLGDVVRHKHDTALPVYHEQEAVQCLGTGQWDEHQEVTN